MINENRRGSALLLHTPSVFGGHVSKTYCHYIHQHDKPITLQQINKALTFAKDTSFIDDASSNFWISSFILSRIGWRLFAHSFASLACSSSR